MRLSTLLPTFLLGVAPALASTTYGCWSDKSVKFHRDCMIAVSALVLQWSGTDDQTWVPPYVTSMSWGVCTAKFKGSGTGIVVPAINLIASFEQLGSRCQNGYFYYDNGYLNAELNGKAGWKRDTEGLDAPFTWNTTETVPHYESKEPAWLVNPPHEEELTDEEAGRSPSSSSKKIVKRATGKYITALGGYALWRGAKVGIGAHPASYVLVTNYYNAIGDLIDDALTNTGNAILRTGIDVEDGGTVNVLTFALQVNGGFSSWQAMFNSFGDSGEVVRRLMTESVSDWIRDSLTAGVYHIYNYRGDVVMSAIVNGIAGSSGSLPSS